MRIREIKNEAKERFAINRYHAMLSYGVVFTIVLNVVVLTVALCIAAGTIAPQFIVLQWLAIAYGIIIFLLLFMLMAPFSFGMTDFYLKSYRYEKVDAFHIFDGFNKFNLERVIILHLLKTGLLIFFTALLIVPGIIYALRTSMVVYLLRANPKMKARQALRASNKIMKGHCWQYFKLNLSFIGWVIFGIVTFGLGFIWVTPYLNVSKIVFYKRELAGDKTVYRKSEEGHYVSADGHDDESDEDDEKNVAVKLMKHQLESEIESYDQQLRIISGSKVKSNELNVAKSTNTNDKPKTMNEMVKDVNLLINNAPPIAVQEPKFITDSFEFELKTKPQETETVTVPEIATVPETELPPAVIAIEEKELLAEVNTAKANTVKTEIKRETTKAAESKTKEVENKTKEVESKTKAVEIKTKAAESKPDIAESKTDAANGQESIHDRLERLKAERAARRESITVRQPQPKSETKGFSDQPFKREKIDVEIDEEDN